jgi:large subunit ribosomal protein L15
MRLDELKPAEGATHRRKKIGRGPGSGHGKTSTRGHKGDKSRGSSKLGFEGGQTPLHRRLPKQRGIGVGLTARGFNTGRFKTHYTVINISQLEVFEANTVISPELLVEKRVIKDTTLPVKVLADGKLTKVLTVQAHKFSASAQEAITALGGTVEIL